MPDISALYPRPAENSIGNLSLPALVQTAQGMTSLEAFQRELGANLAMGNALRGAIDPATGLLKVPEAGRAFSADPRSAYGPVARSVVELTQSQNAAQYNTQLAQNNFLRDTLGSFSSKPNLTKQDVIEAALTVRRNFPSIPTSSITTFINSLPDDPKALRTKIIDLNNMARGSAGIAAPDVTGYGPGGQPIRGTSGAALYERQGVGTGAPQQAPGTVPSVSTWEDGVALGLQPGQPYRAPDGSIRKWPAVAPKATP